MWQYRELITNLTVADLKNKYQNTSLGFFWSLLSPFLLGGVLYIVFRHLFGQDKDYVSNLLVGIMAWRFFSVGTASALGAIVGKPSLVTKVYIPRQILVLSSTLSTLISSFLEFLILLPIIFILRDKLPPTLPLFALLHILYFWFIYSIGLILASVFVYFRDANQIWDVMLSILLFCSPIIYPLSIVPQYIMPYYMLNPITQVVIMYRAVMIGGTLPSLSGLAITLIFVAAIFSIGRFTFSKLQRRFAEEL
jgi:lipopolysaccharide transport system permease protein